MIFDNDDGTTTNLRRERQNREAEDFSREMEEAWNEVGWPRCGICEAKLDHVGLCNECIEKARGIADSQELSFQDAVEILTREHDRRYGRRE